MPLTESLRNPFKSLITDRCGLYFRDYDLKNMESAIVERMKAHKLQSDAAYYNLLTFSAEKENEIRELLNLLTVNHTYFFRNEPQFSVLQRKILPDLIQKKRQSGQKPTLRIWSAGCSTGEEPYTIAIILRELIPDIDAWDIQIFATDASSQALEKARRGIYGAQSVRLVDPAYLHAYFTTQKVGSQTQYVLSDDIKRMVTLSFFNLMDEQYPVEFDVIFCRNVVIYFDMETTINVMRKLHSSLNPDGALFIGYSESLQYISDAFAMQEWEEALYYTKTQPAAAGKEVRKDVSIAPDRRDINQVWDEISNAALKAEEDMASRRQRPLSPEMQQHMKNIMRRIVRKDYNVAIRLIDEAVAKDPHRVELDYLRAEVCFNRGMRDDAMNALQTALRKDPLFVPAHYLQGYIFLQEEKWDDAQTAFQKALYLDARFPLAYFNLAHVYRNQGKVLEAIREYRNALSVLDARSANTMVAYGGGFDTSTLISVCKNNIERLKGVEGDYDYQGTGAGAGNI